MRSETKFRGVLADVCASIDYGFTASATETPQGPKFLRISDIVSGYIDWRSVPYVVADDAVSERYRLDPGDIVIARTGATTGVSAYIQSPPAAVFASYLVRFKIKPEFDARFIAYWLKSDAFWNYLKGCLGDKSAQPNASASTMTSAPIEIPSDIRIQSRIKNVLKSIDDLIDNNRVLASNLESIARRLFKSWFVDFDPVRAKAAGEKPPGLADDIAALFPDRFVESELGEIPEGWAFKPLSGIAEFINGRNFTKYATGTGRMIIRIAELSNGGPTGSTVWNDLPSTAGQYLANPGDILFAWSGSLGIHVWDRDTGLVNQHIFKVIPKHPFAAPFVFFATEDLVDDFRAIAAGKAVTMGHIKRGDLDMHGVTCPSAPELITAFHKIVAPLWDRVRVARREALTLGSIRDLLLPRLISGKLHVKDAEPVIEEALA